MVVPDAVIEVGVVIPNEHQKHAVKEFSVMEGEGENLGKIDLLCLGIRIFLCS